MKIGIDLDDTIINSKETFEKFMNTNGVIINTAEDMDNFLKLYMDQMIPEMKLFDDVILYLGKLSLKNELYFITARSDFYSKNVINLTLEYLKCNGICIDNVHFDCLHEGKALKCVELGIDLFIDDNVNNCLCVRDKGVEVLLYGTEYKGLNSICDWASVYKYVEGKIG